jgi:hypothetical protein
MHLLRGDAATESGVPEGWCWRTPLVVGSKLHRYWAGAKVFSRRSRTGAALALERVHHVHGGDGLAAGVLGVGHRIADHVLEEHLEYSTCTPRVSS